MPFDEFHFFLNIFGTIKRRNLYKSIARMGLLQEVLFGVYKLASILK